jgi:hypothetical protein
MIGLGFRMEDPLMHHCIVCPDELQQGAVEFRLTTQVELEPCWRVVLS